MPVDYINNIMLFVIMLSQHIKNNNINLHEDPREYFNVEDEDQWQFKFLEVIILEGWNTKIEVYQEYIFKISELLKINISEFNISNTIYDYLQSIQHYLFNNFKTQQLNIDIIECFYPDFKQEDKYNELYILPNVNKYSFDYMMSLMENMDEENFQKKKQIILEKSVKKGHRLQTSIVQYRIFMNFQNLENFSGKFFIIFSR